MDKKNTMLLTVIAVATLLVAVVGATFAYFSVYAVDENMSATNVDATVETVGTVTLSGGGAIDELITAADMAESKGGSTYAFETQTVAKATLEDAGTNETYFCEFTLNVTNNSSTAVTMNDATHADGGVTVTLHDGLTFVNGTPVEGEYQSPKDIATGSYLVRFTMGKDGSVSTGADLITVGGAILNSKTDGTQDDRLAGTTIDIDYEVEGFKCDTAKYPTAE